MSNFFKEPINMKQTTDSHCGDSVATERGAIASFAPPP